MGDLPSSDTISSELPFAQDDSFTTQDHLKQLFHVLSKESTQATFACGGKLAINLTPNQDETGRLTPTTKTSIDEQISTIKPVTIRFGPSGTGQTLILPASEDSLALRALLTSCDPATFGRQGEDVYDEAYRKATKLDTSQFTTDFSPYETGVIDLIIQLLLPSISDKWGLRAELYKLNVYSGPASMFKPHVDTPRGEEQIGSLVVCLPTDFEGKYR